MASVNSFGTYLEALQNQQSSAEQGPVDAPALDMLKHLAANSPARVEDLRKVLGADVQTFASMLKTLLDAGLVTEDGTPGEETIALTPTGRALLTLGRN